MAGPELIHTPFTRVRAIRVPPADRAILVGLALLGLGLLGSLIYPFASALLFAAVLAGSLHPLFERLTRTLGGRATLAAGVVTIAVGVLIAAPTAWLAFKIGDEVLSGAASVTRALKGGGGVQAVVKLLPPTIQARVRRTIETLPGGAGQIEDMVGDRSGDAASALSSGLAATTTAIIKFSLMLVAIFFFLLDGRGLVAWVASVAPLPDHQIIEILTGFRNVSVSVLLSSLGTAGVQSLVALVGYLAASVPQPAFFTLVTFVVAFIPALGAASVVLGVAGLVLFNGHPTAALYLALWGVVVVSTIDNFVKPWILRGRMEVNSGLIFFALVGGLATFGPVGLVAGPLILSFFLAVVRLCRKASYPIATGPDAQADTTTSPLGS